MRVDICDNNNILQFHDTIRTKLSKYDVNLIGIIPKSKEFYLDHKESKSDLKMLEDTLRLCDGIILPGGVDPFDYDMYIARYCYEHDIPILGICLGMQVMGMILGGEVGHIGKDNHYVKGNPSELIHPVNIDLNSKFFQIVKKEKIMVNSRHHDHVINLDSQFIVGISDDHIIEAIEDKTKRFFIGVQWHPEDQLDLETELLFDAFINEL